MSKVRLVPQLPEFDTWQSIAPHIKEPEWLEWLIGLLSLGRREDPRDAVLCHVALSDAGKRLLGAADLLLDKWSDHRRDVRCYRRLKRRLGAQATASIRNELLARGKALEAEAWEIRSAQEDLKAIFRRQLAAEKMSSPTRAPG